MTWKEWKCLHILFFLTFVLSGLAVNLIQFVLYGVIVKGFGNHDLFRKINYYLVWAIYGQLLYVADWWSESRVRLHLDPDSDLEANLGKEHALIVMNHHYELDWLFGWMVADRSATLGNARVFVKRVLRYVPIVGWAWSVSDVGFLHREWEKDKDVIAEKVKCLENYPDPAWLLLFAEGTRLTPEKLALGQEFSRERGMTVLKHHLVPRTRGFVQVLENMDVSKMGCIYDTTLVIDEDKGAKATLANALNGKSVFGEVFVRRIPITQEIKDDPSKFLHDLYAEKDRLKDSYLTTKSFKKDAKIVEQPARPFSLILGVTLNLLVFWYLLGVFWALSFLAKLISLAVLVLLNLVMERMISITKIDQGSQYGKKSQ